MKDLNLREDLTQKELEDIYQQEKIDEDEIIVNNEDNEEKEYSFSFG